jgi:hypothetical protein
MSRTPCQSGICRRVQSLRNPQLSVHNVQSGPRLVGHLLRGGPKSGYAGWTQGTANVLITSSASINLTAQRGWVDVQVIGQLSVTGPSHIKAASWFFGGRHTRVLPTRSHACSCTAFRSASREWHGAWGLDRSGMSSGGNADMSGTPKPNNLHSFCLVCIFMSDRDLGALESLPDLIGHGAAGSAGTLVVSGGQGGLARIAGGQGLRLGQGKLWGDEFPNAFHPLTKDRAERNSVSLGPGQIWTGTDGLCRWQIPGLHTCAVCTVVHGGRIHGGAIGEFDGAISSRVVNPPDEPRSRNCSQELFRELIADDDY